MEMYHVVTERPMFKGQHIIFDGQHRNGVYQRVQDKLGAVKDIYTHPEMYDAETLEHHTSVALRELALEQIRLAEFPQYPSRMACLYVSKALEEAEMWAGLFAQWGRLTYQIVKLRTNGRVFVGNANLCFPGALFQNENLESARRYWRVDETGEAPIVEMLIDGDIEVLEIVKEIGANIG